MPRWFLKIEVIHANYAIEITYIFGWCDVQAGAETDPFGPLTSLTLAAMSLGYGVVQLDVTIVNTALNSIGSSLGGGVSEPQWVVSSYTIAFAAFILTAGALGDRIGGKRIFMAGFAIFTAASVGCALALDAAIPIAARGVQRLGRRSGAALPRRPRRDLGLLIAEVRRRI